MQKINRINAHNFMKELWEKLIALHKGSSEAKLAKRDLLGNKLSNLQLEKEELVANLHSRIKEI